MKTSTIMKTLAQKIDALLAPKYSVTQEGFTVVRSKAEFMKRAPWLAWVPNK